jgi:hypothetical protein
LPDTVHKNRCDHLVMYFIIEYISSIHASVKIYDIIN